MTDGCLSETVVGVMAKSKF